MRMFPAARWTATSAAGEAVEFARAAAIEGADLVVAVGGDGTINEVANGLLTSPVPPPPLGIVPAGSGSDFIRSLGLPRQAVSSLSVLARGRIRPIDAGQILCAPLSPASSDARVRRYFVNMAGCGASAEVARRFNRRRIPGPVGYAVAAAFTTLELQLAGGRDVSRCRRSAPRHAQRPVPLQRGVLRRGDASGPRRPGRTTAGCWSSRRPAWAACARSSSGRGSIGAGWKRVAGVRVTSAGCVRVSSPQDVLVDCDGEVCGRLPATYSILPGALTVCVPDPVR